MNKNTKRRYYVRQPTQEDTIQVGVKYDGRYWTKMAQQRLQ
jgi:hypothetical protein